MSEHVRVLVLLPERARALGVGVVRVVRVRVLCEPAREGARGTSFLARRARGWCGCVRVCAVLVRGACAWSVCVVCMRVRGVYACA